MEERLINILKLALKYKATDIHFSLSYDELSIFMRIDGKLLRTRSRNGDNKLVRYLQYLADFDLDRHSAQTGTFELEVDDVAYPIRCSMITNDNITSCVLRFI